MGLDTNALYLSAIAMEHCTGNFVRRREETGFKTEKHTKYQSMYTWMEWENQRNDHNIKHALNNYGGEVRIGPYPVDGFEACTQTVYQYDGCFHHAHVCQIGKMPKETRLERARRTLERDEFFKNRGYNLVVMNECNFLGRMRIDLELQEFAKGLCPSFFRSHPRKTMEEEILKGVLSGEFFGTVEVDKEVPKVWPEGRERNLPPREYFSELPPLFGIVNVQMEDIGDHMREHVENAGLSKKTRKLLISTMSARKALVATPLLKWYLEHGLVVSHVFQAVEFIPKACFKMFENEVTVARREGDLDPAKSIIADTMKLLGNSAYSSIIMQKERQHKVSYYTSPADAVKAVNCPRFRKMTELPGLYEVESEKRIITLDLPVYLGHSILNLAKLTMVAFYYDVLNVAIPRSNFQLCCMDTDSLYLALAKENLEDAMFPEARQAYMTQRYNSCRDEATSKWFMRDCCTKHRTFDRRVPGLMKEEASGEAIIALTSKTYVLKSGDTHKFSCKGINKSCVESPFQIYASVLDTKRSQEGTNRGFRAWGSTVFTYEQRRSSFSYNYSKRKVHDDGVNTSPLDITLCPWETISDRLVFEKPWHPLSPEYPCEISDRFMSGEHAFLYEMAAFHDAHQEARAIARARDPWEFKAYAKMVTVSARRWDYVKDEAMRQILLSKARKNGKVFTSRSTYSVCPERQVLGVGNEKECGRFNPCRWFTRKKQVG